eukprot:gb/GFBE01063338.1/.p1 GENE.gb/GFBE01063338.1/~~gb/GFBE01063338.1/.p1  ORF type:complete len:190 (+),score=23.06 gb/GFBE01063338.1/:1-570(+)
MHQICLTDDMERERAEDSQHALYLGSFSGASMQDALAVRNIRTVLSILHSDAHSLPQFPGVDYWRSPNINDASTSVDSAALAGVLDEVHTRIDDGLRKGSVLVHCMMGISRSGTAVVSYVMRKLGIGKDNALKRVRECRRVVRPNLYFDNLLSQLEKHCDGAQPSLAPRGSACHETEDESGWVIVEKEL